MTSVFGFHFTLPYELYAKIQKYWIFAHSMSSLQGALAVVSDGVPQFVKKNVSLRLNSRIDKGMAMFAVIEIGGHQYKVEEGQTLYVNRLDANEGDKIQIGEVLLIDRDGDVEIGTPHLNAKVEATVLEHLKDKKVIVFKKKRRKGYRVKKGHRQHLTKLKIDAIKA